MAKRSVKKNNSRIRFKWESTECDPVGYKPSRPLLLPQNVYVTVDLVDTEGNLGEDFWPDGDLTPIGQAHVTKILKEAMMRAEDNQ